MKYINFNMIKKIKTKIKYKQDGFENFLIPANPSRLAQFNFLNGTYLEIEKNKRAESRWGRPIPNPSLSSIIMSVVSLILYWTIIKFFLF